MSLIYPSISISRAIYGDAVVVRRNVRLASTTAGTLATDYDAGKTVDGKILVADDRILIKNQSVATENGIYIVQASGIPLRSTDLYTGSSASGVTTYVQDGDTNATSFWTCINIVGSDVVGTNSLSILNSGFIGGNTYVRTNVNTATYLILSTDDLLGVTYTATGSVTLTLPAISTFPANKKKYIIVDEGGNALNNNITINANAADTINGSNSTIIDNNYNSISIYSNQSSSWFIY